MEDPYSILNIAKDATKEEIQESYKALLKKYDISSIEDEETQDIYLQKLSEINLAYTTLIKSLIFKEVRELISIDNFINAEAKLNIISDPNSAEWNYLSGILLLKKGWVDSGIIQIQKAININPYNEEYKTTMKQLKEKISINKQSIKQNYKSNALCYYYSKGGLC